MNTLSPERIHSLALLKNGPRSSKTAGRFFCFQLQKKRPFTFSLG